ncbi:hypothetical protein SRIMM317S_03092 [Streptomyces rimosus subsp. rimosus]
MREPAAGAARPNGEETKAVGEDPKLVKYFQRVTAELQAPARERLRELENPVDDPVVWSARAAAFRRRGRLPGRAVGAAGRRSGT